MCSSQCCGLGPGVVEAGVTCTPSCASHAICYVCYMLHRGLFVMLPLKWCTCHCHVNAHAHFLFDERSGGLGMTTGVRMYAHGGSHNIRAWWRSKRQSSPRSPSQSERCSSPLASLIVSFTLPLGPHAVCSLLGTQLSSLFAHPMTGSSP